MNWNSKLKARTLLATSALCALLLYACRKDLHPVGEELKNAANGLSLKEAKSYYTDLKKREGGTLELSNINLGRSVESQLGRSKPNKKYALFEKSIAGETYKSDFVEVPITYDQRITTIRTSTESNTSSKDKEAMFRNSFDRLVIYKSKSTGEIKNVLISYVPNATYLKANGSKLKDLNISNLRDFSGYLEFKKWNGASTHIVEYQNGKRTRSYKTPQRANSKIDRNQESARNATMALVCHFETVEEYGMICMGGDSGEDGSGEQYCYIQVVASYEVYVCDDDGTTGDPCIDYGDCGPDPDPCILYGGCEEPPITEPPVTAPVTIILDPSILNNQKMNCLMEKLLGLNGNEGNPEFNALLQAFKDKGFDITFKIGATEDEDSKAEASISPSNPKQYSITINQDFIDTESQMSWAKTLIHEAFHANLLQKCYELFGNAAVGLWHVGPKELSLEELMDKVFDLTQGNTTLSSQHHEWMAENFEVISDALQSFSATYNSQHSNFGRDYFDALSYEGLNGTHYYNNKVAKDNQGNDIMVNYSGGVYPLAAVHTNKASNLKTGSSVGCN